MKNLNRQDFELVWRDRFENYSVEPDEMLWIKLDAALANEESVKYKRRALYLQMVATAALFFAIAVGLLFIRHNTHKGNSLKTISETATSGSKDTQEKTIGNPGQDTKKTIIQPGTVKNEPVHNRPLASTMAPLKNEKSISDNDYTQGLSSREKNKFSLRFLQKRKLSLWYSPEKPSIYNNFELYETSVLPSKTPDKKFWAGINMGSGVFDPNISYGTRSNFLSLQKVSSDYAAIGAPPTLNNYNPMVEEPQYDPGITYVWGINFGHDLGKKWIIQTSVDYQLANSSTGVNTYFELADNNNKYAYQAVGMEAFGNTEQGQINTSGERIELKSTYDFLVIPVMMGYKLYDGTLKWIISGGISPVLLIQNKIYSPDNLVEKVSLTPGSESTYKPFNLNGVLSSTVGLTLFNNYQLSISPSYNFGLGYLTKETNNFNSRPSYFMVAGNLSYIFN